MLSGMSRKLAPDKNLAVLEGFLKGLQERKKELEAEQQMKAEMGMRLMEFLTNLQYRERGMQIEERQQEVREKAQTLAEKQFEFTSALQKEQFEEQKITNQVQRLYQTALIEDLIHKRQLAEKELGLQEKRVGLEEKRVGIAKEELDLAKRKYEEAPQREKELLGIKYDYDVALQKLNQDFAATQNELDRALRYQLARIDNQQALLRQQMQLSAEQERFLQNLEFQKEKLEATLENNTTIAKIRSKAVNPAVKNYSDELLRYQSLVANFNPEADKDTKEFALKLIDSTYNNIEMMFNSILNNPNVPIEEKQTLRLPARPIIDVKKRELKGFLPPPEIVIEEPKREYSSFERYKIDEVISEAIKQMQNNNWSLESYENSIKMLATNEFLDDETKVTILRFLEDTYNKQQKIIQRKKK